jgi:hypothetical protein
LTALGAVLVVFVLGAVGGGYDLASGMGLRTVFAVCFVAGCAFAALTAHREDLRAVVVMPPLVYLALAVGAGLMQHPTGGSITSQQAIALVNGVVLGAPGLLVGTALAALLAGVRALRSPGRR